MAAGRRETACTERRSGARARGGLRACVGCGAPEPPVATAPLGGVGPHLNPFSEQAVVNSRLLTEYDQMSIRISYMSRCRIGCRTQLAANSSKLHASDRLSSADGGRDSWGGSDAVPDFQLRQKARTRHLGSRPGTVGSSACRGTNK